MAVSGYTGISFPFRVGTNGGAAMSTTSVNDVTHIEESIIQILTTDSLERPMEGDTIYGDIDIGLFEPNNEDLQDMLREQIVDALDRLEERIEVEGEDIDFTVETTDNGEELLFVDITYLVTDTQTYYTAKNINLGVIGNG